MSLPISGFMPIPLAIMPPFMAYQSLVMGDAFGRAFQFGKRKISAMGNEEFNKLDIVTMFETISNEYTRMIPSVEKAMSQSVELQVSIVKELLRVIPELGKALFSAETFPHSAHGHPFGDVIPHGDTGEPLPTEEKPSVDKPRDRDTPEEQQEKAKARQKMLDRRAIDRLKSIISTASSAITAIQNSKRHSKSEKERRIKHQKDAIKSKLKQLGVARQNYKNKYGEWY